MPRPIASGRHPSLSRRATLQNPAMNDENRSDLAKGYEHREVEARWYPFWRERGFFHGDEHDRTRPPFSIVLPPPNVTGSLHLGHALTATLQDVLIRWKKMSGFNTLWLPGTDHAGIATQMIVEKELKKTEKKSRHDLGRAAFLERVWAWKEKYGSRIGEQHEALGAALDWDRERFTMDEGLSRAVREVFVRLHEEGLIYREKKLINWCPDCRTALSDLEVEHEEAHPGELWSFAYPLVDPAGHLTEIVVATTRPETMLGDTAVAVHPDDERYRALVGKKVRHRRGEGHAGPRLQRLRGGKAPRARAAHGHRPRRPHDGGGRSGRGARAVRGAQAREGAHRRAGARSRHEAARAAARALPALADGDRAAPAARGRGGGAGEDPLHPRGVDEHVHGVDAEHPRLVHQPAALVGPPDPGLVLPGRPRDRGARGAGGLRDVWQAGAAPGRRRPRHLVLVGALAVLDDGLAG